MNKTPYLTEAGKRKIEEELADLRGPQRDEIAARLKSAIEMGDLSENADYHAAKEAQGLNEARISELEEKLGRAEVIDVTKLSGTSIKFGARVTVVDEDTDEERTYQIVGDLEADVKSGKVSISSPIARALIGKKVGDSVEVATPGGARAYEILEVRFG